MQNTIKYMAIVIVSAAIGSFVTWSSFWLGREQGAKQLQVSEPIEKIEKQELSELVNINNSIVKGTIISIKDDTIEMDVAELNSDKQGKDIRRVAVNAQTEFLGGMTLTGLKSGDNIVVSVADTEEIGVKKEFIALKLWLATWEGGVPLPPEAMK